MTTSSYHQQPNNPNAFDLHAFYGGIPGRVNEHGTPLGHGHIHITQNGTQYHRQPVPNAVGQIAVRGLFH
jgi:hypothetical protein